MCAHAERFVGAESGGMDQAICFMAERHTARLISFVPALASRPVRLPARGVFLLADSMRAHHIQGAEARTNYNTRVVECRVACAWLEQELQGGRPAGARVPTPIPPVRTLAELHRRTQVPLGDMARVAADALPAGGVMLADACARCGWDAVEAAERFGGALLGDGATLQHTRLFVRERALHVLSEAQRVAAFVAALDKSGGQAEGQAGGQAEAEECGLLEQLGGLMRASQRSCAHEYACSCPELDALTSLLDGQAGVCGSRLTGAGWGGWCIALVSAGAEAAVASEVRAWQQQQPCEEGSGEAPHVLVTTPGQGACIIALQ